MHASRSAGAIAFGIEIEAVRASPQRTVDNGVADAKNCGFCENGIEPVPGKTYQVIDLIRLMTLFNNTLYPYQSKHPVQCYTAAGRLVDKWETEAASYQPLIPMLPKLMRLHDDCHVLLGTVKGSQKGRPRNGIEKKEQMLPFTSTRSDYKISSAFVYPLVASLRVLLDGQNRWRTEPERFLEVAGPQLVEVLMAFYDEQCKS